MSRDLVHTVPMSREPDWDAYVEKVRAAPFHYYQTSKRPTKLEPLDYVYLVHSGHVRARVAVLAVFYSETGESNPIKDYDSPPGWYVVKSSVVEPIEPEPQVGFQGWRYR